MNDFERSTRFTAAFDRRDPDPSKDCGIHGCECTFTVKKDGKGITFTVYTNWMLPHVQAETDARRPNDRFPYLFHKPQPAGVSYHDTKPHHEGQSASSDKCDITGGACYSDGSFTMGDGMFTKLVEGGSDALFAAMEALYAEWFEGPAECGQSMSAAKHTPGPWQVDVVRNEGEYGNNGPDTRARSAGAAMDLYRAGVKS